VNKPFADVDFLKLSPRAEAAAPEPQPSESESEAHRPALSRLLRRPIFVIVVLIPNLLSILYFGFLAAPIYVSTASLVVLNPQKSGPSLSSLLAGASGDSSEEGGYLLKNYLASWQAFTNVEKPLQLARNFNQGDIVSRYGGLATLFRNNDVALWTYLNRHVDVTIDPKSGIVALKTEAYRPDFAFKLASAQLSAAIAHMDAMNLEQERDYVRNAIARKTRIEQALQQDLAALARFRIDSGTYDPKELYASNLALLNSLAIREAELKSQRDAINEATPNNPVVRNLRSQMASVQGNITATKRDFPRMARNSAAYEKLLVSRDTNISLLSQANMAVHEAQLNAEKNRYYLNVISTPSQPQTPEKPRRLLWITGILLATMLLWGVLR
jgi:capsular polysaccharide transport system permease protein